MSAPEPGRDEPGGAAEQPVDRLSRDMADVARSELRKVRDEVLVAVRDAGAGAALLAGAGTVGLLALQTGSITLLRMLEARMPPARAAAVLTTTYVATAATLALLGIGQLRVARGRSGAVSREVQQIMPERFRRIPH